MDERKRGKLRRIEGLRRRLPHISASSFVAVLKELQDDAFDESITRALVQQARDVTMNDDTPYGKILITLQLDCIDGSSYDMPIADPFAMLYSLIKNCHGFARLVARTLDRHPNSFDKPWRMVLYSDEVVPGNQMSFHNLRKVWVLYYSFMEFGMAILSMEDAWICIGNPKSDSVKKVQGGMAQVFGALLKHMFSSSTGHNMMHGGLFVEFPDGTTLRIWIQLEMFLQDGGAHKQVFLVKGDAGSKFCTTCRTLYAESSGIVDLETNNDLLTCNKLFETDMDFATDNDIRGTVERLAEHARTARNQEQLNLRQQACGFNHHAYNMLLDLRLRDVVKPVSQFAHDWMHTFMVHGVWNTIMMLLLLALAADGVQDPAGEFAAFVCLWTLPRRISANSANLAEAFSSSRWKNSKKAKYFKATASDALALFSIVACMVQSVFKRAGRALSACECYLRLADLLDLLVALPHGTVTPTMLRNASDEFLRALVNAGWRAWCHPKFHWIVHLARELERFGMLLSCWVHERKHRMVKRYSQMIENTIVFEKSVLSEVTCHHFAEVSSIDKFDLSVGLVPPVRPASRDLGSLLQMELQLPLAGMTYTTSRKARVSTFEICGQRDVVLFHPAASNDDKLLCGEIWAFCDIAGHHLDCKVALVAEWPLVSKTDDASSMVVAMSDDRVRFVAMHDIKVACCFRRRVDDRAQVLVPCIYRNHV